MGARQLAFPAGRRVISRMPAPAPSVARQRRVPPILIALGAQAVAAALTVIVAAGLGRVSIVLGTLGAALLTGALAAVFARVARLDRWWLPMQFAFAPALWLVSGLAVPRWVWLVLVVLFVLTYWSTFRSQVPLYLSSTAVRQAVVRWLPAGAFRMMDVGSGVGGVLIDLSRVRRDGTFDGIETAPVPWAISRARIALGGHRNCSARWGSFWDCDLAPYDVVFAYLSPVPMAALWEKVQREMRPGSAFISNTFPVSGRPPTDTMVVDDVHQSTLYLWRM
jgi:hypothetical protein